MKQWVCRACGYNMIGECPEICPFCGAHRGHFLSWEEAQKIYRVTEHRVSDSVSQLVSEPRLGLEHAAYRIETERSAVWIDCPSVFDRTLKPVHSILFTHSHFMGACNQYRSLWRAKIWIHELDAGQPLIEPFPIDERFGGDFEIDGISAHHIGGHTPGFTLYLYQDVLFICDYAFPSGPAMRLNPFGPARETLQGAEKIRAILQGRSLTTVCAYNYVCSHRDWRIHFEQAIDRCHSG